MKKGNLKKLLAVMMSAAMVASMAGCGSSAATTESQAPQETASKAEETGTAAAETVDISAQGDNQEAVTITSVSYTHLCGRGRFTNTGTCRYWIRRR